MVIYILNNYDVLVFVNDFFLNCVIVEIKININDKNYKLTKKIGR